jgi:hypothetical protein
MADIYDWSTTAADNDDADSTINWLEGQLPGTVNGSARAMMKRVKELLNDLTYSGTVGGTADAITLTSAIGALADNKVVTFKASADNTGAATLAVNGLTAKAIRKISSGTDVALSAGDIEEAVRYVVVYDSAANSSAGAWIIVGSSASVAAATTSAAGIVEQQFNTLYNIGLTCSVAASALTIALKDAEGNDPSASSPVIIPFRNVTAGTGTPSYLTVTAATSLVISSGSTMGFTSGTIGRLWIVGFNDGGTFRLGAVNCLSGVTIMALRDGIYSSTAEGGAGGADTAQVIYTGTAVTSKAMVILGYLEATEATAGTWATAPSLVKVLSPGDALPGDAVQAMRTETGATASGTGTIPYDDSIPQSGEGTQFMTQAITPKSGANLLCVTAKGVYSSNTSTRVIAQAIFRDATAGAISTSAVFLSTATNPIEIITNKWLLAGATTSTTFNVNAGGDSAGTFYFNGTTSGRVYGGVMNSYIDVQEYVA